ncbi:hypothetical protein RQP46_006314 [Phenoliferia psychrophenolica]
MCCTGSAQWKREEVPDHKFDFIDVRDFHATNCTTRLQYAWLYVLVVKSFAVYVADIYTMVALLASNHWSGSVLTSEAANSGSSSATAIEVPFSIGKWIFFGCIVLSMLLFLWEARKSRAIIRSRDISYAFTNVMAQNYYSLKSYDHFCFFSQIDNSKKKKDELSFFVFFTFKSWKRLLLADAPRQVINGLTLYSFGASEGWTTDISVYFSGSLARSFVIVTMLFSVVVWVGSTVLLIIAAFIYVPLLCYIQGNLKEYCCHKVDKRIEELMKRKTRKRLAKEAAIARKEAKGDFSHLKDSKTGKYTKAPLPQPTLPTIDLDDDRYAPSSTGYGSDAGSLYGGRDLNPYQYPPHGSSNNGSNGGWPQQGRHQGPNAPYAQSNLSRTGYPYQSSSDALSSQSHHYAESVNSQEGLASHAAPMAGQSSAVSFAPSGLRHQPSYPSMQQMQAAQIDRSGAVSPAPSYSGLDFGNLTREPSMASQHYPSEKSSGGYATSPSPSSQQQHMYEHGPNGGGGAESVRGSAMTLGHMRDELGRLVSDGGWESSRTEVVAQEYDDRWDMSSAHGGQSPMVYDGRGQQQQQYYGQQQQSHYGGGGGGRTLPPGAGSSEYGGEKAY